LYSLVITFNFDAGNQLLEAKGLCIPANNTSFVTAVAVKVELPSAALFHLVFYQPNFFPACSHRAPFDD